MRAGVIHKVLGLSLLLMPWLAPAGEMLSAVRDALAHDAELAASGSELDMARQEIPKARAALLPRLDGGWGRTYNRQQTDNAPTMSYWQNGWMITLNQPVFDWERWVDLKQAGMSSTLAELEFASARQDLMLRSATAYMDMLVASQRVSRAADYLRAVSEQRALALRLQAGGEATVIDVQEATSRLSEAQLQLQDAERELDSSRSVVATLIGRDIEPPRTLPAGKPKLWLRASEVDRWVRQAQSHSFPVQLAQLQARIADGEVEKARAQRYPVVNLSASHSPSGAASGYSEPTTTNTAMLTISAPIFTGGENRARIRQASAGEEKAQNTLLAATRKSGADAREWYQRFNWARDRSTALEDIIRGNQAALESTRMGFKVGSRTNLDVLRAQEAVFTSRSEQTKAVYDMLSAFLALKAEIAGLTLDDIQIIDSWLSAHDQ
ncbi:TolC family outer membrane protein [Pseudomonas sp. NY15435]|uniref:TolC family outer membrane protein n=1 Tax=Pseudomonas sp. NY15435 TaxID=3400358 RepID=UPI003A8AB1C8